ncbi:MAG: hypothetical protein KIT72_05965 [Polyangiaceae bacterium]|nr:hypothetical protein [Polyangiaceae bacterium]MCW5789946.1 hypothetical protein [Polyangiaceae bacterium]
MQSPPETHPAPSRWLRLRWFGERYAVAHLVAYPPGVVAAFASIPLALRLRGDEVLRVGPDGASYELMQRFAELFQLDPTSAAQTELVVVYTLKVALVTLVFPHLTALPWALAAARRPAEPALGEREPELERRRRWFMVSMLGLTALWVVVGVIGWVWVLTL